MYSSPLVRVYTHLYPVIHAARYNFPAVIALVMGAILTFTVLCSAALYRVDVAVLGTPKD